MSPRVLLLALPRSGSTWVGRVLGSAKGATYLHEPVTRRAGRGGFDPFAPGQPPPAVEEAVVSELAGIDGPVVMKEVAVLRGPWLGARFGLTPVLLLRDPVAVVESHLRLGWVGGPRLAERIVAADPDLAREVEPWLGSPSPRVRLAAWHAAALRWSRDRLDGAVVVRYEDFRSGGRDAFRPLFDRLGLRGRPDPTPAGGPAAGPFSTRAPGRSVAARWEPDEVAALAAVRARLDDPWG